jgi:RNA polymerase sigma-70 factor, ECF subfamily
MSSPSKGGLPRVEPDAGEARLVTRARAGDRAAFGELVVLHQERVWALAWRLTRGHRERAEDLAQEAFLRALNSIESFRGEAAFATWMHRIVVNLHINRDSTLAARHERRARSIGAERGDDAPPQVDPPTPLPRPDVQAMGAEELALLRAAFDELDEARRIIVVLRDVEGRSYEEIAEQLSIPIGTVRSRLARAREELARKLGGSGFGGPELRGPGSRGKEA